MRHKSLSLLFLLFLLAACAPQPTPPPTVAVLPTPTPTELFIITPTAAVVPQTISQPPEERGQIRLVQAAPESGVVDVYLAEGLIASQLGLGSYTNPVSIGAGNYTLRVVPTGTSPDDQALAQVEIDLLPETTLLILITGTADNLTVSTFEEDLGPVPPNQARMTYVNAVPRGPALSLRVGENVLEGSLDFGQRSSPALIDAGMYPLMFVSGSTEVAGMDAALASQQAYTAVLVGSAATQDYRLVLLGTPVQAYGRMRFIHAGPELPEVDVFIDGAEAASNLVYRQASQWADQPARSYTVTATADGDSGAMSAETRFSLNANQAVEVVILPEGETLALRVVYTSLQPTPPTFARLVAINAAPESGTLVPRQNDEPIMEIPPVAYGMATRAVDLPAGAMNLSWWGGVGGESALIEPTGDYTFAEGHVYTYVLTGAQGDPFILDDEVGVSEQVVSNLPSAPTVQVRVINALAEAQAVNIRLSDVTLAENLEHASTSGYLPVPQDRESYRLVVEPAGGGSALFDSDITLGDDEYVAVVLAGITGDVFAVALADYGRPVQAAQSIFRVIHAAPGTEAIYVSAVFTGSVPTPDPANDPSQGTPVAEATPRPQAVYQSPPFSSGEATGFIGLPQGDYAINISADSDSRVITAVQRTDLESGRAYDLILMPGEGEGVFTAVLLPLPED